MTHTYTGQACLAQHNLAEEPCEASQQHEETEFGEDSSTNKYKLGKENITQEHTNTTEKQQKQKQTNQVKFKNMMVSLFLDKWSSS